ncbi:MULTISPECIES: phosphate signaling complex protein PhoU [Kocuria]|uniref:phosphate signaling complex protein PhoU n=1 Tax=Kocuria TaxID=57493 RepID=UPI0022753673|nr:phosphate signaling complex protein PhoU [Kocuria sp. SL71]MCY1685243.1 phosphate signaling complex protein PhoU [Kocuria sp. SL71]
MRTVFQAELKQVGDELVAIARLVRQALSEARSAFLETELETAQGVISNDARIDLLQDELDERSIDILARQSPVASDLRTLVAALRMSTSLERMGDLARHLAQDARRRFPEAVIPERLADDYARLFELDLAILDGVIEMLETRDISLYDRIAEQKAQVSAVHRGILDAMGRPDWDAPVHTTVDVTLSARYLERMSDHGIAVARKVSYLVTGQWAPPA